MVESNNQNINIKLTNGSEINYINKYESTNINNKKDMLFYSHITSNKSEPEENIINLNKITKYHDIPRLFEMWTWGGDESILPFKVINI